MLGKPAALLAALSLGASPALAQPSAQPLSIQPAMQRSAAPMHGESKLAGDFAVEAVILVLLVGGILLAAHALGNGPPSSP